MTDRNNEMNIQTETEQQIMKKIKYRNDKITFETFLSGTPARDYVFQKTPYEEQIRLNLNEAVVPESLGDRAVGINADMKESITDIAHNK